MASQHDKQRNATGQTQDGVIGVYLQAVLAFSPSLRRFLLAMSLGVMATFGLSAVLQNLYLLRLGFDVQFIGLMVGLGQVVWAVAALPAGLLSNRIGLRNGVLLGYALLGLGLSILLLAETWPEPQWRAWLMVSQVVVWTGAALVTVNIPPYVMAVTQAHERRYAFAAVSATFPTMSLVGSLIGGVLPGLLAAGLRLSLDRPEPYRLAFWLAPALYLTAILVLARAEPAHVTRQVIPQDRTARAPLALLAFFGLVAFLGAIGEGALRNFFTVFLDTGLHVPPAAIGTIMGLAQLLPIGAALVIPLLVARWGTGYALAAAFLGAGLLLLPLAAIPLVSVVAVAYVGVVAMITVSSTARDMFGQEIVIPRWRTTSQGVAVIGLALGFSASGIGGGMLIKTSGFGTLYLAGALAALLAGVLLVGYLRWVASRQPSTVEPVPAVPGEPMA